MLKEIQNWMWNVNGWCGVGGGENFRVNEWTKTQKIKIVLNLIQLQIQMDARTKKYTEVGKTKF